MVLTRLSHSGSVCPLSDHSYSDSSNSSSSEAQMGRRLNQVSHKSPSSLSTEVDLVKDAADVTKPHILSLPTEVIDHIFTFLTYKQVGDMRRVCRRFESVGSGVLNSTFLRLQTQMLNRFQTIKTQMPRRESARRKHPLARESDIVETLHMRLTLLQMSFSKHIERKHCCFFAGEILDEVVRILRYIKQTPNLGRAFKVTDELFDLSSMAMEYFKEHIEPSLPEITYFGSDFLGDVSRSYSDGSSCHSSSTSSSQFSEIDDEIPDHDPPLLPPTNMVLRKRIRIIRKGMKRYNTQLTDVKRELKACRSKIGDQHKQLVDFATRMEEYDKKFEESSRKFSTLLQELNKSKTELQFWKSKSPTHPVLCYNCGQSVGGAESAPPAAGSGEREGVLAPHEGEIKEVPIGGLVGRIPSSELGVVTKNLEHLFDARERPPAHTKPMCTHVCNLGVLGPSALTPCLEGDDVGPEDLSSRRDGGECSKRRSSDDDSDYDDTVGQRVKKRKRSRVEG